MKKSIVQILTLLTLLFLILGLCSCEYLLSPNTGTSIGDGAFKGCRHIKDVYYTGSPEDWYKIDIESDNYQLQKETIHFNYVED